MKKQADQECPVPTGKLIIIGGAEDKSKKEIKNETDKMVLKEFVNLCGSNPVIELITTAGSESVDETYEEYANCFESLGAKSTGRIHHESRLANLDELADRVTAADGIFITGGDQLKLTSIYGGTEFMTLIKERYIRAGLVLGGTSAGAMAMSTPMIFGGTGSDEMVAAGVKITTGFEFLKDVCIDTHFVHRGRFVRMAQVIATNPSSIGIGIEEDTAIIISEGTKAKVVGNGVVIIIDGQKSSGSNIVSFNDDKKITIRDLNVSILSADEKFVIPQRNPPHL